MPTLRAAAMLAFVLSFGSLAAGQEDEPRPIPKAPARAEGEGPWKRLVLRGVTVIDGTGAPPFGRARPPIFCCSTPIRPWTSTTRSKSGA